MRLLQRDSAEIHVTRRHFGTLLAMGSTAILAACSRGSKPAKTTEEPLDLSARFAGFAATDEPDVDPARVVWPDYVTDAAPEVRSLYEFQLTNGELMRYMPCFCGCNDGGHFNNRDCYIRAVNPDGSAVFDSMAPT